MKKIKFFLGLALILMLLGACEDESKISEKDYLSEISGTYYGDFSIESDLQTREAGVADVTVINNQLQIHCYGAPLDTTFLMDAYEHGDSIFICHTGLAFEMEYGHMGSGHHHMMNRHHHQSQWQRHMSGDHKSGDIHYGGFNMRNNTFEFMFRMMDGNSEYHLNFRGIKN